MKKKVKSNKKKEVQLITGKEKIELFEKIREAMMGEIEFQIEYLQEDLEQIEEISFENFKGEITIENIVKFMALDLNSRYTVEILKEETDIHSL